MIRTADTAEFPELLDIQLECLGDLANNPYNPDDIDSWKQYLYAEGPERYGKFTNMVAVEGFSRYGFVSWSVDLDGITGTLECLYVTESERRKGLGSFMLRLAERGIGQPIMTVQSTLNARPFYEANGYRIADALPPPSGFVTLAMQKRLYGQD